MSKRIIVPAYSPYPDESWEVIFPHAAEIAYVILNVDSGVGVGTDPVYVAMAERLNRAGVACLGYVASTYGQRSLDGVKTEIRQWFERYKVSGIFCDEMDYKASSLPYYKRIKSACGTAQLVTNPGGVPESAYRDLDAIICVAETDQQTYLSRDFPDWTKNKTVAHIVFSVTDAAKVLAKIEANQADYFYLTTAVPEPGASGPEFNIPDTIWPPAVWAQPEPVPAPPATARMLSTCTDAQLVEEISRRLAQ